jgi:hypothetical protein
VPTPGLTVISNSTRDCTGSIVYRFIDVITSLNIALFSGGLLLAPIATRRFRRRHQTSPAESRSERIRRQLDQSSFDVHPAHSPRCFVADALILALNS